jgi:PAS domain-containing protein
VLQALVEQSLELIAITDRPGTITWANSRFSAATGIAGGDGVRLVDCAVAGAAGDLTRDKLASGVAAGALEATALRLRTADDSPLWVDVRAARSADSVLWTFTDISSTRFLAAQARRQGELLDTAQEFGRIGLWERRIPSGEGRWDRHVFGFWGLDPATGTPPFEQAIQRIHPDDRKG